MALLQNMLVKPLNIFYQEPDPDRWIKYDRYLRRLIRPLVRGKQRPGGVMMVALNLMKGLDKTGTPYRLNDYKHIYNHPEEIACIIGKPQVLFEKKWDNPVIFGAGIYSHPIDCPDLLRQHPNVKRVIVPGNWMQQMFEPYYGDKVLAWPTGINTDEWKTVNGVIEFDFLIYDKIRWEHDRYNNELLQPIIKHLAANKLSYTTIRYGEYDHTELKDILSRTKGVIFLCEHETQGLAYQQILATNTPVLAWDRGGYWQDPAYYPDKVKYQPVSSVPYWDGRCGTKFTDAKDFEEKLKTFLTNYDIFKPREYILENLTLELCAMKYLAIHEQVEKELGK
jgi:hypothetical protein